MSAGKAADAVRVLVCDDSATARSIMARVLDADPAIQVVGRVADGRQALDTLAEARPDIVLLDLEMPVMDGMTALPLLLRATPRPAVIVASALTQRGAAAAMAALRAGAVDYVPKPSASAGGANDPAFRAEIIEKVKGWARIHRRRGSGPVAALQATPAAARPIRLAAASLAPRPRAIGIGCSTGGPQALAELVRRLVPAPPVPIVVVQHMPAGFTAMLADHLARLGGPPAVEAQDGVLLRPGHLYLAPGDRHLLIDATRDGLRTRLTDDPPENFCRPAVDPMLRSLSRACDGRVLAVILTGMGQDGLLGCQAVAAANGAVLAQDEASSVVWGMPGAVAKAGLAQALLPPAALAERLLAACNAAARGGRAA